MEESNKINSINYFPEVNDSSRFNNALLNEIRKTNQLLENLILSIHTIKVNFEIVEEIKERTSEEITIVPENKDINQENVLEKKKTIKNEKKVL